MNHDVIVIGGSYAGMAASLQLLRARRSVLIIDAGQRRNRFASHAHGFLGQDGVAPDVIASTARRQLEAYPTLTWLTSEATGITGAQDAFVVTSADGQSHHGRRVLFATGVTDQLPKITGLAERWGRSVFHCPYCHGYELDQGCIGVIATGPMATHQAELLSEWGKVTLLTNHALTAETAVREELERRGVTVEDTTIRAIAGDADVQLTDGRVLPFAGLFVATTITPSSSLPAGLGCEIAENPMGRIIAVDASKQTTVPGVFACGDVAFVPGAVSFAVADGALAGIQLHRSLVRPETMS